MFNKTQKGTGGYFIPIFLTSFVKVIESLYLSCYKILIFFSRSQNLYIFLLSQELYNRSALMSSNLLAARAAGTLGPITKPNSINFNIINQRENHSIPISDFSQHKRRNYENTIKETRL